MVSEYLNQQHFLFIAKGIEEWQGWGVRIFETKCDSVKEYIRLLNEHTAYEDFRTMSKNVGK